MNTGLLTLKYLKTYPKRGLFNENEGNLLDILLIQIEYQRVVTVLPWREIRSLGKVRNKQ